VRLNLSHRCTRFGESTSSTFTSQHSYHSSTFSNSFVITMAYSQLDSAALLRKLRAVSVTEEDLTLLRDEFCINIFHSSMRSNGSHIGGASIDSHKVLCVTI
jgi:hypothetical protein